MRYGIIGLMMLGLLSGCGPVHFDRLAVPDVISYPPATQEKAAQEIEGGACPVLVEFAKDYGVMRDQARAASGKSVQLPLLTH